MAIEATAKIPAKIEELTEKERTIVLRIRSLAFGNITVFIEDGKPVRIKEERTTKL